MAGSRKYYSEYVGHFVRFFLIYPNMSKFRTPQEEKMYTAVHTVWLDLASTEREILERLYLSKLFSNEVDIVSKEMGLQPNSVWKMVFRFENTIAGVGGLI